MATTDSSVPVNGNYAHQGYEANNYAAANSNSANTYAPSQQQTTSTTSTSEIPKDEVGWYFVEQYYTTLSKTPERLFLFYNKRSQFVSGTEEEKVQVCMGQKSIGDRIKELDFQDTKVRVTNVDSQGSDANIVIQVIGEISTKGQPHKRFVQTFVLAEQTNGYFVLNDIFRYLADEPEEEEELQQEAPVPSGVEEPAPSTAEPEAEAANESQQDVAQSEEDLAKVDEKLEETAQEEPAAEESTPAAEVNGAAAQEASEAAPSEETPVAAAPSEEAPTKDTEVPAAEEALEPEKPKEPAPTPAPVPQKPAAAAAPAAPPKPAAPRTWASLIAAPKPAAPATPAPAPQQAPAQPKPSAPAASQPQTAPATQPAPAREPSPANSQGETAAGWQSVTGHKKEPSRAQNQGPNADPDVKRAFIKNVYSQVEEGALRAALSKVAEVQYLDIARGKNCAFVEFKNSAAFQAVVSNNPYRVNGIDLTVEERHTNRSQGFKPYPRGNGPRGRGGLNQGPPRGGFNARGGRGGTGGRGGRPAPQEA